MLTNLPCVILSTLFTTQTNVLQNSFGSKNLAIINSKTNITFGSARFVTCGPKIFLLPLLYITLYRLFFSFILLVIF